MRSFKDNDLRVMAMLTSEIRVALVVDNDIFRRQVLVFFVGRKDGGGIRSHPLGAVGGLQLSDLLSNENRVFLKIEKA